MTIRLDVTGMLRRAIPSGVTPEALAALAPRLAAAQVAQLAEVDGRHLCVDVGLVHLLAAHRHRLEDAAVDVARGQERRAVLLGDAQHLGGLAHLAGEFARVGSKAHDPESQFSLRDAGGGDRAPGCAPAFLHEGQADQREDAEPCKDQQTSEVAARVLAALAHHVREQEAAEASTAADEAGHKTEFLAEALRQELEDGAVAHAERAAGESKYSLFSLIRLNFDLITGFSLKPLQMFSLIGMGVASLSVLAYLVVIVERWLLASNLREALLAIWDRDILTFFLIGLVLFGLGLVGEYVGRIYEQVRHRPRFLIQAVLEQPPHDA